MQRMKINEHSIIDGLRLNSFWNFAYVSNYLHVKNFAWKRDIFKMYLISNILYNVCVCVFIFFHREGFFRLQDVQDILEGMDQRSCVVNISWLCYAKFHHRRIWKCHVSPPKTKTPAVLLLERKRYDIIRSAKRWYILI